QNVKSAFVLLKESIYLKLFISDDNNHVLRFLQDINEEFNPNSDEQTSYFIGSAIIVKTKDGQYDVIDGQQRLTTIIISLCALRDILSTINLKLRILNLYICI
ncbi:MAG: DUF262 domain-containing protein, partial [Cytophagaceae bacterium]|nr:DUF262 domain-containing protein [Cytophagaceae bacterium]